MYWYIYAILASFSFVGMILCIKKLTDDLGFSSKRVLFFVYLFLFLGFLVMNIRSLPLVLRSEYFLPLAFLTFIAGIFSVVGNWADFEGIKRAPNAGYSVAIRNSSILLTVFASVFLFGSELALLKLIGIIFIVIGITLLVIEKKKVVKVAVEKKVVKKEGNALSRRIFSFAETLPWYAFSFIAFFTLPVVILIAKEAILLVDFSIQNINLFIFGSGLLILSFVNRKELKGYITDKKDLKIFLFLAVWTAFFSFMANVVKIIGLDLAPNPGYNDAVVKTSVLLVTLLSVKLFSAELNRYKLLGVAVITIGLIIMVI